LPGSLGDLGVDVLDDRPEMIKSVTSKGTDVRSGSSAVRRPCVVVGRRPRVRLPVAGRSSRLVGSTLHAAATRMR